MCIPLPFLSAGFVSTRSCIGRASNGGHVKCVYCVQSKRQSSRRREKKPPIQQRVSLMSGQQPWQAPDGRWYTSAHGSPSGASSPPPGWPKQPRNEKPQKESRPVSFREWLSATAGIIAAICAIITLVGVGGTIVVVKILAPHNDSRNNTQNTPSPTPDHSSNRNSQGPFNTAQLQTALLPSGTVGQVAAVQSTGTDMSQIEGICGGPLSGDTATAYENISDQQDGRMLDEVLVSWDSTSEAGRAITVARQTIDQRESCSITSNGATLEYTGDDQGSPPSSCVNPGQYLATQVKISSSSIAFPFFGFAAIAQCGPTTIFIRVYSHQPGAITQQVADGYLSSAVDRLKSTTS